MSEIFVYHAVTERPMELGQIITFDENHHNGVYDRGRKVYQIVKLRVDGNNIFDGDAYNVFDGTDNAEENETNAEHYWSNKPNRAGKECLAEILISGNIEVVEIVKEWT